MAILDEKKDAAAQQTAAGMPDVKSTGSNFRFEKDEIETLRTLAKQVAEIAARPEMAQKAKLWTAHNDLKTTQPVVFIDPENGWNEIITPDMLRCRDNLARVWEMHLRKQIYWAEHMRDDKVIEPYFDVPYSYSDTGWGLDVVKLGGQNGGSYIVKQAIEDYEEDFEKVHHPEFIIDWEESGRLMALAQEIFGDILIVRRKTAWWWSLGMCWDYIDLRGLEDFMCDFILEPEWVHRMMNLLCNGKLKMLDFLQQHDLLSINTGGTYVGSGGFGYTEELPLAGFDGHATTRNMWGFCESQETVSINPDMYGEFIFPYHQKIMSRFGLNCYGCCEPYDPRWKYIKQFPRLRRVSVSPWADWKAVPEVLGKNYIASVKPNPTPLATPYMDEDVVRADCRRAVEETYGGVCEFIMKDNNTLGGDARHATRWVEIMREEIDRVYG